jgi:hypothetical protein
MQQIGIELGTVELKLHYPTTAPLGNIWYCLTLMCIYNIIFSKIKIIYIHIYWKIKMLGVAAPKGLRPWLRWGCVYFWWEWNKVRNKQYIKVCAIRDDSSSETSEIVCLRRSHIFIVCNGDLLLISTIH